MIIVKINKNALSRVIDGHIGMTFIVDSFTRAIDNRGLIAHVRDYRYTRNGPYQIWSIGPEGYEVIHDE